MIYVFVNLYNYFYSYCFIDDILLRDYDYVIVNCYLCYCIYCFSLVIVDWSYYYFYRDDCFYCNN